MQDLSGRIFVEMKISYNVDFQLVTVGATITVFSSFGDFISIDS